MTSTADQHQIKSVAKWKSVDAQSCLAPMRLALSGAAPDTGNLGVSALSYSVIDGIADLAPSTHLTVFDHGFGRRRGALGGERDFTYERLGLRNSKRIHLPESLWNVQLRLALGLPGNATAQAIRHADAVLDITGGDSFTDLYGPKRFGASIREKRLAIKHSGGLVLLPQTIGPYRSSDARRAAADVLRRAALVWSRDERSYNALKELVGDAFDPSRHRLGVDVAFGLPALDPGDTLSESIRASLGDGRTVLGFNVSGLIYNNPQMARDRFEFRADYRRVVELFLTRALRETDAEVLLTPHVAAATDGHFESDQAACDVVAEALRGSYSDRVHVLRAPNDPRHAKWAIARTTWFCGTRMHSTIAGLSSGVPTAAIAYSVKTRGVFATCNQASHVADPREQETDEVVDALWRSWQSRDDARSSLQRELPNVLKTARTQMIDTIERCQSLAAARCSTA